MNRLDRIDLYTVEEDRLANVQRMQVVEWHPRGQRASLRIDNQGLVADRSGQAFSADHMRARGLGDTIGLPMVIRVPMRDEHVRDSRPF